VCEPHYPGAVPAKPFRSVWARERRETREQALSREHIVRAAIDLLDAEGLEKLSMRRLGARLSAGATSLYWYVESKDELLELVMDEIYGQVEVPEGAHWREAASAFAYGLRDVILRHPWLTGLIGVLPAVGPNALTVVDRLTAAFEAGGFTGADADHAVYALIAYAHGAAIPEIALHAVLTATGMDSAGYRSAIAPFVDRLTTRHPRLRERYRRCLAPGFDPVAARALAFDHGLAALLDGLEARLARRPPGLPEHRPPTASRQPSGSA